MNDYEGCRVALFGLARTWTKMERDRDLSKGGKQQWAMRKFMSGVEHAPEGRQTSQ
jgi:hypothetical protein